MGGGEARREARASVGHVAQTEVWDLGTSGMGLGVIAQLPCVHSLVVMTRSLGLTSENQGKPSSGFFIISLRIFS